MRELRKRYGATVAVDGLSFTVQPGQVTGFVGPNGAGKSTTMRVILGLDAPDGGSALVGGRRYRDLGTPLREVGALLDAGAVHPGRKARDHLLWMAQYNGLPARRVDEVLEQVGLAEVARRRAGGFSLGHAAAARHRRRVARGPAGAAVRRAGERARPGGHRLDPRPAAVAGRRGPGGAGVQPPDGRAGRTPPTT